MHKRSWVWAEAVNHCEQQGDAYALVTVLGCSGSTPREQRSKMVVTADSTYDSIGGGNLEFVVTNKAREQMAKNLSHQEIIPFPLGGELGQCCGGNTTVLIETFAACRFHIGLFGGGHVAQALVKILAALPCKIHWTDNRENMLPTETEPNISLHTKTNPRDRVSSLPDGADIVVMTHNHQLDYDIIVAALKHTKLRYIGLIGSKTKAQRFKKRLMKEGFCTDDIAKVKCPIGLSCIPGKLPMEIAVSIAGELIAIEHQGEVRKTHRGLAWVDIKRQLSTTIDATESKP